MAKFNNQAMDQNQALNQRGNNINTQAQIQKPTQSSVNVNEQIQQLAKSMANQMVREMQQAQILSRNGRTYTRFDLANDVISNQKEIVTGGIWSDGTAILRSVVTSSAQTATQREYYVDVLNSSSIDSQQTQFSVTYGHALGSGSDSSGQLNDSATRAIYGQYRQLLLAPTDSRFSFGEPGVDSDHIYVINFKRSLLKERLDPGNWELPLIGFTAGTATSKTASSGTVGTSVITLIDDSSTAAAKIGESGRVYNIVSGSINGGIYNSSAPVYWGLAYPDYGVLILNGNKLDVPVASAGRGFGSSTGSSVEAHNHITLFRSISGSALFSNPTTGDNFGFMARNSEKITSTHYFIRIKNAEYNFSNNPSYVTGSVGQLAEPTFNGDPKTFITTVGLYNDRQELLAVAKLSKPLLKSFQRESLIRVKLDY